MFKIRATLTKWVVKLYIIKLSKPEHLTARGRNFLPRGLKRPQGGVSAGNPL